VFRRRRESLRFGRLVVARIGLRMLGLPLRQIFFAQPSRPTFQRICLGLGTGVLGGEDQSLPADLHGALGAVKSDWFSARIISIAAEHHAEFWEVEQGLDEIGEVASV